jgi:putative oxidoreductase
MAAEVLAGLCVETAVTFHANVGDQNQMIHFLKRIAMTGGPMQVVAFGGGAFSIDTLSSRLNGSTSAV